MRFEEDEKRKLKKLKHRPNQPGVGMRILNEHDADEPRDDGREFLDDSDDIILPEELFEKYLKKP